MFTKEELTKWLRSELRDLIRDATTVRKDHPNNPFYQGMNIKCAVDTKAEKILDKLSAPDLYEALKAIGEEPNFGLPGHLAVMRGKALAKAEGK